MKKVNISISRWLFRTSCAAMMAFAFASCSNLEDNDHYGNGSTVINNNELKIVNMSSAEYMNSRADLSDMSNLFKENGRYSELNKKGQLSTMLVVTNDNYR